MGQRTPESRRLRLLSGPDGELHRPKSKRLRYALLAANAIVWVAIILVIRWWIF